MSPATEHNTTFTAESRSSLVFRAYGNRGCAARIQRDRDHDRTTSHLAILDVLLIAGRTVDEQLDRLAAVRASGVDGGQHPAPPRGRFVRGGSVHPSHRVGT